GAVTLRDRLRSRPVRSANCSRRAAWECDCEFMSTKNPDNAGVDNALVGADIFRLSTRLNPDSRGLRVQVVAVAGDSKASDQCGNGDACNQGQRQFAPIVGMKL